MIYDPVPFVKLVQKILVGNSEPAVADPGQAFGRDGQIRGRQKVFTGLNTPACLPTIVRYHTKVVSFCRPRKWLFLLVELCDLSGNHQS